MRRRVGDLVFYGPKGAGALQIAALLLRGLVFEYLGLTALGAYVTLYQRYAARGVEVSERSATLSAERTKLA